MKIAARGDLLMSSPAFRLLRESNPEAHLVLLVGRSCHDVARHLPFFDEVRVLDDQALFGKQRLAQVRAVGQLLREISSAAQGDAESEILLFQRDWRYALLAWLARIPVRKGFLTPRSAPFLTHAVDADGSEHHVSHYLGLARLGTQDPLADPGFLPEPVPLAGNWQFLPGEQKRALAKAALHGFDPRKERGVVALGFGGGNNVKTLTDLKSWPTEQFVELAHRLVQQGWQVVWLGDSRDARKLPDNVPGVMLAGKLDIGETAAVLGACSGIVANDSFLLHLGETLGVPSVGIFGPTHPLFFRPLGPLSSYVWLGSDVMPCSPCAMAGGSHFPPCRSDHRCMRDIPVSLVLERLQPALERPPAPSGIRHGVSHS